MLTKIQQTIAKTKKNIVQSVDYQKVLMSWQIGKEIELQLTQDTEIEKSTLYKMHAFHKAYPKVPAENKRLSWSHYRRLIAVKDQETRQQLEDLVVKTNKTDIYGRYIADVFLPNKKEEKDLSKVARDGVYLSQMLLDLGLVQVF